ncbi:hypothetical protein B566_EDAN008851 [Ephemera danica]|nr:hypothetical protein B566_EDAN008851 [Ephemera danica]
MSLSISTEERDDERNRERERDRGRRRRGEGVGMRRRGERGERSERGQRQRIPGERRPGRGRAERERERLERERERTERERERSERKRERSERRRIPGPDRRAFIDAPYRTTTTEFPLVVTHTINNNVVHKGHHPNNGHHADAHHHNAINTGGYANGRPSYLCPAGFVRLGNACYMLSQHIATWQEAHFACRDLGSQLAGLETAWEDQTIRHYLNKEELARLERWIGGIFNWEQKRWIWGSSGKRMSYQGFSRRSPNEERQWHCVLLDPTRLYRWTHRSCIEQRHFICEAPLQKNLPHKDKNEI